MDEWDWHRVLDVNLTGVFLMTQSAGRVMRARGEGVIVWSEERRLGCWLEVEICFVEALARRGLVPTEAAALLRANAGIDPARMAVIEAEVKHDLIAFVSAVAETVGDEARFLHLGLTSSDVVDTGLAMQLHDAGEVLVRSLDGLRRAVRAQAERHRHTPMIGRTHGIHAEPITFGLKCAGWYAELGRGRRRLVRACADVAYGKLSGAVGSFANNAPDIEAEVCSRLGV
jgi:adenylosuccinate lyase